MEVRPEVRHANRRRARRLGYPGIPADLPPPAAGTLRTAPEVVDRVLAVHVVVAVAHGLDVGTATRWLSALGAEAALTPGEAEYLADVDEGVRVEDPARRIGVEGLTVLLWALDLAPAPDWEAPAEPGVLAALPGPGEPLPEALLAPSLRDEADLVAERDLVECMAWALGDDELNVGFAPGSVEPYVVWERRRALEWLFGAG